MKLLKQPCKNCPFLKAGAIPLKPGRLEGIIAHHAEDDHDNFACHKTTDGEWIQDDDGEETYIPSGRESSCMGAIAYLTRMGRPSLAIRFALAYRLITMTEIQSHYPKLIDPLHEDHK